MVGIEEMEDSSERQWEGSGVRGGKIWYDDDGVMRMGGECL